MQAGLGPRRVVHPGGNGLWAGKSTTTAQAAARLPTSSARAERTAVHRTKTKALAPAVPVIAARASTARPLRSPNGPCTSL